MSSRPEEQGPISLMAHSEDRPVLVQSVYGIFFLSRSFRAAYAEAVTGG
jgi:hypothetical protein